MATRERPNKAAAAAGASEGVGEEVGEEVGASEEAGAEIETVPRGPDGGAVVPRGLRGPLACRRGPSLAVALGRGGNLPEAELAPYMAPQRAGDPLGIGLSLETRPPAPPDPDVYDRARENAEYTRSLLDEEERQGLDEEIAKEGYMTIEKVRDLVAGNTAKGSVEAGGLDPEIMALVDARIDYKVFVAGDNLYTREELYDHYPFHEFCVQPEAVFCQQEIGIFPPRKHALKAEFEYVARDVGDESVDFVMLEDLVGQVARRGYRLKRAPLRVVKTKIYVGKERWEDFALLQRFFRGAARVSAAQIAYGGQGAGPLFSMLCGGAGAGAAGGPAGGPPLLMDRAGLEAALEAEQRARAAHEAAMAEREAAMARREAEAARLAEAVQQRIDADLRRVEAMLAAAEARARRPPPTAAAPAGAAPPGDDAEDSVPLF